MLYLPRLEIMTKTNSFYLLAFVFLIPAWGFSSDTRVNSVGGLSLVMDDETAAINPFTFGNPAGLSLLPPQSRFDVAGPWFQQTPASNPAGQVQAYGTLSKLGNPLSSSTLLNASGSAFTYQGFILFPTNQWAFQLSGDLFHANNQFDTNFPLFDISEDRYRGLARTAYNFGPFALGTEAELTQVDQDLPSSTGQPDGQGNISILESNSGLIMNFPLDNDKRNPATLRIGGEFGLQANPSQDKQQYDLSIAGNPVTVDLLFPIQTLMTFGPEAYVDVMDSWQAGLITRFSQSSVNFEQDSSNTSLINSIPSYKANDSNSSAVIGVFKAKLPLIGTLRQKLSVNTGGFLIVGNSQSTSYNSSGTTTQTSNNNDLQTGIGIGIENEKDFTVGVQAALDSLSGNAGPPGGTATPSSYFGFTASAGGEKWIKSLWAFRMGLVFEDDFNGGAVFVPKPYYLLAPGERVVSTTLNAGVGFQDSNFKWDFMLWTGQPSLFNSPNPVDFATQIGVELATTVLF